MRKVLRRLITQHVGRTLGERQPRCIIVWTLGSGTLLSARLHYCCLVHDAAWAVELDVHHGTERIEADTGPTLGSPCPPFRTVDAQAVAKGTTEVAPSSQVTLFLEQVPPKGGSKEE